MGIVLFTYNQAFCTIMITQKIKKKIAATRVKVWICDPCEVIRIVEYRILMRTANIAVVDTP